jgi:hypothetical protein
MWPKKRRERTCVSIGQTRVNRMPIPVQVSTIRVHLQYVF